MAGGVQAVRFDGRGVLQVSGRADDATCGAALDRTCV
jgi:hypothetical protein